MAMQVVGGAFLQVAFDRLASSEVMDFVRRWKIDLNEVENLKLTSAMIQALTDEAEVKQFTRPAVKLWLNHLKQLLYDAEDVLDEYATDILKVKLESQSQIHPDEKVRNPVSLSPSSSESSTVLSLLNSGIESVKGIINQTIDEIKGIPHKVYDIYEKLRGIKEYGSKVKEINDRLKGAAKEGLDLGLSLGKRARSSRSRVFSQRPPTTSLVNKNRVFGRDEDKEKIIEFLLRDEATASGNDFSVLPIVGMGGLGKTTLAQLVYDADRLIQHFDLKAWVCVGEEFDILKITKIILESVTGKKPETDLLDRLQNQLQQELSKKKFFMVLDDVWNLNSNKWDTLTTPFAAGALGSKIVVTTRDKKVSLIMHSVTAHQLERLSDEACIHLLRKHAFVNGNSLDADRKLEIFGSEVVEKCKGLPLAVKTIAGLLRGKTEDSEWTAVLENEIWDLEDDESEILPSLMLSYHHLSPHLKRCFAYCALFPKDFEFEKIDLVKLWMAEGFVQSKETKRLEDIGEGYFDDLFRRSFFELSNRPSESNKSFWSYKLSSKNIRYLSYHDRKADGYFSQNNNLRSSNLFVMHDLIHDLAQFVSSEIYCRIDGDKPSKISATTRHLMFHVADPMKSFRVIKEMKSLHTLLVLNNIISYEPYLPTTHQHLRVLRLIGCVICELPRSIGNLKHLRLLDLSSCLKIESLPDSIGSLYNLQTLILSGCKQLRELPKDMGDLVNLRHLFLPDQLSRMEKMPLRFGSLTNLQTLTEFIVGLHTSDSGRIGELRNLSQLRGTLKVSNLENVGNTGTDDIEANLKNKPHLRELQLCWSDYKSKDRFPNSRNEKVEENVLDQLQPHTNIEMLRIVSYGGTRFPSWVGHRSFSNLEAVILSHCHNCMVLPYLGQLSSLKYLMIDGCSALKITGDDDSSVSKKFQSLETLIIYHMTEWEKWFEVVEEEHDGEDFPCLHKLTIRDCPKLTTVSHRFSSLVTLTVEKCNELRELPRILPSLRELKIVVCEKLLVLPSLPSIQRLTLYECHQITTLFGSQHLSSPSSSSSSSPHVCVSNIEEDGEGEFRCLRELYIFCCPNLRKLARTIPSLVKLRIEACKELSFLPMLPSIEKLKLEQCNKLEVGKVSEFSSLSYLYMKDVSNLSSLPCGYFRSPTALQQLKIYSFNELMMVGLQHLTSLKRLVISKCPKLLSFLPDNDEEEGEGLDLPSCIEYLDLSYCDSLKKLPQSLYNLHCLKELIIEGDVGLACLPKGLDKLTLLQEMQISKCPSLVSLAEVMLPIGLRLLFIDDCHNLESLPNGLHNIKLLMELRISECPSLVSLAEVMLPIGLRLLFIDDCHNLESLPNGLHNLTSLESLKIIKCPALESFPDMGLPTTILCLIIEKCVKLNSLPMGLHKLRNLKKLYIVECSFLMECKNLEPLCSLGLQNFTSLYSLHIGGCPNLVSIPKGLLPINLEYLVFIDCPILESLHDGLSHLNSLKNLDTQNCPMLKQRYQQTEGEEWSKIAQIPLVRIDGEIQ